MASFNRVILMGNLTRDPELRRTPSGIAVCDVRLAVNENFRDKNGERVEKAVYVDISVWGQQAESCERFLRKGSPVFVEGRLQYDEWESQQGEKRNKLRVVAARVQFLGPSLSVQGRGTAQTHRAGGDMSEPPDAPYAVDGEDVPF